MTERSHPLTVYPDVPKQKTFFVEKAEYDRHGRPLFSAVLNNRPSKTGVFFTVVHTVNGRPDRSYDIAIVGQPKPDLRRPLAVVYAWTGRGFEGGMEISQTMFPGGYFASGREAVVFLALKAAPVAIGGVTGFVVGIFASIPATAEELRNVIVNARETVVGWTTYEYDERGRIRFMKLFPPDGRPEPVVTTEFVYAGESDEPDRTEVKSAVEGEMRVIR